MSNNSIALLLSALALVGSLASWLAPQIAASSPRAATVLRVIAHLAINVHGALTTGLQPVDLTVAVRDLQKTIEEDKRARAEELAEMAKRREPYNRLGWLAAAALVSAVVSAFAQAASYWAAHR